MREAETLLVCTHCRAIFPSPISFDSREIFESINIIPSNVTCPKCKVTTICSKENIIFYELGGENEKRKKEFLREGQIKEIIEYVDAKIEYELALIEEDEDGYTSTPAIAERKAVEKALAKLGIKREA